MVLTSAQGFIPGMESRTTLGNHHAGEAKSPQRAHLDREQRLGLWV